jgi:uncharacterized protein YraI
LLILDQNKKQDKTMRKTFFAAIIVAALTIGLFPKHAVAVERGDYEVMGVEGYDMLKLRAGPGIGYKVIVGLPNGTALRVHSCQQTGGTVIPPFLMGSSRRTYAAAFSFIAGVIPPMPMLGRSLL